MSRIAQDGEGVTVTYKDNNFAGAVGEAKAEYCVCTIPLPVLSQLDVQVGPAMQAAIAAVPYASSVKLGLEFKRRFWEEDEAIYGGISFTDQPISQIAYPSHGYFSDGPAVLLGGYMFGPAAYDFAGMTPGEGGCEAGRGAGLGAAPAIRRRVLQRCGCGLEQDALDAGLLLDVERGGAAHALQGADGDRWAHRAGRGTCLDHRLLAGGGAAFLAERDHPAAPARRGLRLMRGAVLAACAAFGWAGQAWGDAATTSTGGGVDAATGQAVFQHVCQGCHMDDARGARGAGAGFPALAGNRKLESAGYPIYMVENGHGAMPWFNGMLSDTQVAAVVNYVRSHFGNRYSDVVTAADVAAAHGPAPVTER